MAHKDSPHTLGSSFEANGDRSGDQFKFVAQNPSNPGEIQIAASGGGDAIGVLENAPDAQGKVANVTIDGVEKVQMGADNISAGMDLTVDSSGKAKPAGGGDTVVAESLDEYSSGQIGSALLKL